MVSIKTIFIASEMPDDSMGICSTILIAISWIFIILTFPVSFCMCFKIVQEFVIAYLIKVYNLYIYRYERAVIFRLGRLVMGGARGPVTF